MNIETLREKVQLRDWETLRPYLHSLAVSMAIYFDPVLANKIDPPDALVG